MLGCDGLDLYLALEEFIGESVPEAKVISAPYFLLELMKKKFEQIKSGQLKVNQDLVKGFLDEKSYRPGLETYKRDDNEA